MRPPEERDPVIPGQIEIGDDKGDLGPVARQPPERASPAAADSATTTR